MSGVSGTDAPSVPDGLLARLRADPVRAPETIALSAAERFGPAAAAWAAEEGRTGRDLARKAKKRHARLARVGGAAGGVGGAFTMLPDIAALVWIQSRMVFFIAAALGYDPRDPMRPAELLVLYELYEDPAVARSALDGAGQTVVRAMAARTARGRDDEALTAKLAKMGLKRGARSLAGRVVPGLAIVVNSVGNERATRELADDAIAFYGG
jgi:hypothetical protein